LIKEKKQRRENTLRKLQPKEVQEGKVFHNAEQSVRVLRIETIEFRSPPLPVVVFQKLGNRVEERRLSINDFCAQYKRRKR